MSEPNFKNVSNPAAFGVEWTAGNHGSRYQLVNPKGTSSLLFGVMVSGSKTWSTTPVIAPDRFLRATPETFGDFLEAARAYAA
ncbi:hypothetical protein [Lentzea sp. CC55]|uniref:hypothetical protein n=1 Tax=Lentzea sp. CC55 TaxID=2884909 RepID=UPI001F450C97|nr:hypothetical protein [Lentzea sp. CC55]MCG8926634.1 hypothetical protein [Lentzea sp. CC55]